MMSVPMIVDAKHNQLEKSVDVPARILLTKDVAPAGLNLWIDSEIFNKLNIAYPTKPRSAAIVGVFDITLTRITSAI